MSSIPTLRGRGEGDADKLQDKDTDQERDRRRRVEKTRDMKSIKTSQESSRNA